MFAATTPASPSPLLSTTTTTLTNPPLSPTGGRSRLRGLSYLRSYTQTLHTREPTDSSRTSTAQSQRPAYPRAQSQPSTTPETFTPDQEQTSAATQNTSRRTPSPPNTAGWLPAPAGRTSSARPTIRQQSTASDAPSSTPAPTVTTTAQSTPAISRPMTRNRADTAAPVLSARQHSAPRMAAGESAADNETSKAHPTLPSIRFIPHFDPRANRPSLSFPAVTRTLPGDSSIIRVGRYSERENAPEMNPSVPSHAPVGFKSKVVSRRHCEFWCANNQWFIKDVKSSSGTFLNHLRLSPPGIESRAYPVNDGDVVQLGIDFRGGEEMIFRCVKIRIECNRGWQKALNNFNKKTHKQLRNLTQNPKDSDTASVNSSECAICLMSIAPCQSLFVAPCSHVWHYKCIRPILNGHTWPNFLCPNCRAVADLEADVEEAEEDWEEDSIEEALAASRQDPVTSSVGGSSSEEPDGVKTPRAMEPLLDPPNGHPVVSSIDDDDLGPSLSAISTLDDDEVTRVLPAVSTTASLPRAIPIRSMPGPVGTTSYELTVGPPGHEGPMTPRNDAGPFVLDGGAGATTADDGRVFGRTTGSIGRRSVPGSASVQSLDATAAEVGTGGRA